MSGYAVVVPCPRHLPTRRPSALRATVAASHALLALLVVSAPAFADPAPREFLPEAKALLVVGACAEGAPPPSIAPAIVEHHCAALRKSQDAYRSDWLAKANPFFAATVPKTVPKTVVYPFAGGDLSTALTVYPDADEITTLSLEPAGDPLDLARLSEPELKRALVTVETELGSLYRANFSVTMNMIPAMRGGSLPTQLIFSLSALSLHGYELTAMRYFKLSPDGDILYLSDADVAAAEKITDANVRNRQFANVELRFHKTGSTHEQIYRHILANLDDKHLKKDPAALRHLEKKGHVAGMTKAASYLLTFDDFSWMRKYIIDHVDWMVSDSTGLPPAYGTPAGFTYETHGAFLTSNMAAGGPIAPTYRKMFADQPSRPLDFRFGYPDGTHHSGHLIIMSRASR
ncbi:MAG TPA: hypothetical protein VGM88_01850 [Kofleriaceae bacterium]|jgi:hypothetical protein